jgi:hypothetical protein
MQLSTEKQKLKSNNTEWYFLAEYSLSKYLPDDDAGNELAAGLRWHTSGELSILSVCAENIENIFTRFIKEALAHFRPGRFDPPIDIRLYCQKKMINEKMNGGWGYFLIERAEDSSDHSTVSPQHFIELYIYREGE